MSTSELKLNDLPGLAHGVVDVIFQIVSKLPDTFDRLETILITEQDRFVKYNYSRLAEEIQRLLPPFKTFLLASRRQNIS